MGHSCIGFIITLMALTLNFWVGYFKCYWRNESLTLGVLNKICNKKPFCLLMFDTHGIGSNVWSNFVCFISKRRLKGILERYLDLCIGNFQ